MLADPAAISGSAENAFDVVTSALPGFDLSDRPPGPTSPGPRTCSTRG